MPHTHQVPSLRPKHCRVHFDPSGAIRDAQSGAALSRHLFQQKEKHAKANTRKQQPGGLGPRPGLHGLEPELWASAGQTGAIAFIRAAVERGVTFFDTAQSTVPFTTRSWWAKRSPLSAIRS